MADRRDALFPALLKHWRHRRGLSQLDLALAADVSSRHVSFLETGRSQPSPEMVLRLASTLGVSLRHANAMLRAAGHEPTYEEAPPGEPLSGVVAEAIELLKTHAEPFPLVVVDRAYDVLDLNTPAALLLAAVVARPEALGERPNLLRLTVDPAGARDHVVNLDEVARAMLWRAQRELLEDPDDERLRAVVEDVLASPAVEDAWRDVDLAVPSEPVLDVHLRTAELDLRFLTTVTAFTAPQHVAVDELRVETWLPRDTATADACAALSAQAEGS